MILKVDNELIELLQLIKLEGLSGKEWEQIEASDMFQSENYSGGYDALEAAFTFSYYDTEQREFWFQITLDEIEKIISGEQLQIAIRPAE